VGSDHGDSEVYSIQQYVIKFVSDMGQIGGFLWVLRFPPPMKLPATIYGVQRHFQLNCSYIVAGSFMGGGNLRTQRKPPICPKSLTNFITYCCIEYTSLSPWSEPTTLVVDLLHSDSHSKYIFLPVKEPDSYKMYAVPRKCAHVGQQSKLSGEFTAKIIQYISLYTICAARLQWFDIFLVNWVRNCTGIFHCRTSHGSVSVVSQCRVVSLITEHIQIQIQIVYW
jgi:hypothetical protein